MEVLLGRGFHEASCSNIPCTIRSATQTGRIKNANSLCSLWRVWCRDGRPVSAGYPITPQFGFKLTYLGTRTQEETGIDSDTIALSASYFW